jgi:hypothetical protein
MSTTPTTPEGALLSYTVVGGARQDRILASPHRASLLLLNRGPRFERDEALAEAEALAVGEVISVERASIEVDTLSREHPDVRFLLVPDFSSVGELIDIGVAEARGRHVVVLWSDMRLESPAAFARELDAAEASGAACVAPELLGPDGAAVPCVSSPALAGSKLTVKRAAAGEADSPTLYPFDYCGVYRKDRFLALGGFDVGVSSPYWQKLHFGLLAHLWGETIVVRRGFRLAYRGEMAPEDTTPDAAYRRFYLRTAAVRLRAERAYLPVSRFLPFAFRSGATVGTALAEFREARRWVGEHGRQYRHDLGGLVELWGRPE